MCAVSDTPPAPPVVSPKALSDALAALGAYTEAPSAAQLAAAELANGREGLSAQLSNALYGSALAHVMSCQVAAADADVATSYRHEAWRAAGADNEGILTLLHYTALRLSAELRAIDTHLPIDLGVMGAAAGAAEALTLLLQVCTVRDPEDPRADAVTTVMPSALWLVRQYPSSRPPSAI